MNCFRSLIYLLLVSSCSPTEETGLARYFADNRSGYDLKVMITCIQSVSKACDTCLVYPDSKIFLGEDAAFGHAPGPDETVIRIRVYKNDTLKIDLGKPYGDTVWAGQKGNNTYDYDFSFRILPEYVD